MNLPHFMRFRTILKCLQWNKMKTSADRLYVLGHPNPNCCFRFPDEPLKLVANIHKMLGVRKKLFPNSQPRTQISCNRKQEIPFGWLSLWREYSDKYLCGFLHKGPFRFVLLPTVTIGTGRYHSLATHTSLYWAFCTFARHP